MVEVHVTGWGEMCSGDVEAVCNMSCSDAAAEPMVVGVSMWVQTLLHGADLQSATDLHSSDSHWQTFLKLGNFK